MLLYYLGLALRSVRRNVALALLAVLAIAFGVGASMTTLTVLRALSADPIPEQSERLFHVQLEPRTLAGYTPNTDPPLQLTRLDAEALLRAHRADRQAMMTSGTAAIQPPESTLAPFFADGRWTSSDFFAMFKVPFDAGGAWTANDDASAAPVVVIAHSLAERLFGRVDIVGRSVRVDGHELRVVGVIAPWQPEPHFYDVSTGAYGKAEEVFVPFSTSRALALRTTGTLNCWGPADEATALDAPCEWIQFWVELDSRGKVDGYRAFLTQYSEEQRRAGRFARPTAVRLRNVSEWLAFMEVVPNDARLQAWIALAFLLVCLVNTVGLLLTKFLRRSGEIGLRRAVGGTRESIFLQLIIEAGVLGLAGGVAGLGLAWAGLWTVRQDQAAYAAVARLDTTMLLATFMLSIASSIAAGIFPAWRACRVVPAKQLKSN